jgi:hypothetical protein
MFANAAITVMMLRRHLRSSLPVEIVHYGESELSKEVLPILQELNSSSSANSSEAAAKGWAFGPVYVTDGLQAAPLSQLAPHHKPLTEIRSFPAKVYALTYATRFQQVSLHACRCADCGFESLSGITRTACSCAAVAFTALLQAKQCAASDFRQAASVGCYRAAQQ